MISRKQEKGEFDIILISGEYYVDHPSSGIGILAKVLEHQGYRVGIIEKPDWKSKNDFLKLGKPKLFFGVTSGMLDSMICNYTPLKKLRKEDQHEPYDSGMPDRAILVYCNRLKESFPDSKIVLGGIEPSMRRFSHYDYWSNVLRGSILLDSRADILVYGPGEKQIIEIAERLKNNKSLENIQGTCISSKELPKEFIELPTHETVLKNKLEFIKMQKLLTNNRNLAQKNGHRYVLQYKQPIYTTEDLDYIYGLDYSRDIPHYFPEFRVVQFSVVTHRGCIGRCNFCSITLMQGDKIVSRSEKSILQELEKISKHRDFKGVIDDLGGPSANMYGMDCHKCEAWCMKCKNLDTSHRSLIHLLKEARKVKGIKKIFVRSGVRYDLALKSPEYVRELSEYHISGNLKIAPEHFAHNVLRLLNKDNDKFDEFKEMFEKINKGKKQGLKYYFMTGLPGETLGATRKLKEKIDRLKNTESIQIFTPSPMTNSTCMYYTAMTLEQEKIGIPFTYNEKKKMKNILYGKDEFVHSNEK